MNKNTVKRSCTAGVPDFLPRQKDQKNQAQQKEDMWPEINPWNVMFSVLGAVVSVIPASKKTSYHYIDQNTGDTL
ncbi:hypothetical protein ACQSFC_20120 [Salmonella enterica]|uniref:hypothetical protein n=1 Tax=Salmonella enterica TaxID=28901 RepID=UPI000DF033DA|nr:hypothetical protein DOE63_24950 [Salmonella enterica subsp. diarizonae serovar 59:z10:-]EBS5930351.1 hypothetical protein [Salmonella enterica subsp. enterica serovar Saintpaul]ECA5828514.1 hypothetical protein [Salmonella enterica subsp. enterica serovar Hvittingfoss]EEL2954088.1 hypothetical protein [Salmonella enterica]EEH4117920.1 hypothetical protein [Salmonella enterica subsp. enterica serovar Hvittingfoss]